MGPNEKLKTGTDTDTARQHTYSYLQLTRAIESANARTRDALASLSVAEIRPTISFARIVDTVNELHTAVEETVSLQHMYVAETLAAATMRSECVTIILKLQEDRRGLRSADAYRLSTSRLMDEIRRSRTIVPPALDAAVLVVSQSLEPPPVALTRTKVLRELEVETDPDTDADNDATTDEHTKAKKTQKTEEARVADDAMIKKSFKKRIKFGSGF